MDEATNARCNNASLPDDDRTKTDATDVNEKGSFQGLLQNNPPIGPLFKLYRPENLKPSITINITKNNL